MSWRSVDRTVLLAAYALAPLVAWIAVVQLSDSDAASTRVREAAWILAAWLAGWPLVHGIVTMASARAVALRTLGAVLVVAAMVGFGLPRAAGRLDRVARDRTLEDLKTLGAAVERYSMANGSYPEVVGTVSSVASLLEPTYVRDAPRLDGWGEPLVVASKPSFYVVASVGLGGEPETADPFSYAPRRTRRPQDDLVYANGTFVRWPDAED